MADGRMKDVAETRGPRESNLISKTMKNKRIIELAVKMLVAAFTAFLTALTTTSCMGKGPFVL